MQMLLALTLAAQVLAVDHHVTPAHDQARVQTTLRVGPGRHRVALFPPLPAGHVHTTAGVAAPRNAAGMVEVLELDGPATHQVVFQLPLLNDHLVLPAVDGGAPTRVVLPTGWRSAHLAGWDHHTTHATAPGMDAPARRALDRLLQDRVHTPREWRLYFHAREPLELVLRSPEAQRRRGWWGAAGVAGVALVGLWWWQRGLKRAADLQHAESILAREMPRFRMRG